MKRLVILFCLCLAGVGVFAQQTLHSSYFMKRMPQRHKLNPALMNDYGYIGIPGLSNVNFGIQSDISLKAFLYPTADGNLMTFMHPDVSAAEFEKNIKNNNGLAFNFDYSILSFGFYAFKGYNTFDLSLRSSVGFYLPGDLFRFMKFGMDDENGSKYHLENLRVKSNNYVELAFGHARKVTERLQAGAKVKVLLGAGYLDARMSSMDIELSDEQWLIRANGEAYGAFYAATLETKADGEIDGIETDFNSPALSGWGLGFDFGATYQLMDNLTLSAALVDLGFVSWKNVLMGETRNDEYVFDGFDNVNINEDDALDDELDKISDEFESWAHFYEAEAPAHRASSLQTTLNIGGEYTMWDDRVGFGLLSSTRFSAPRTWTELMASVNFRPINSLNLTLTGTVSNSGANWGWVLNFCPRSLNFFIGTDKMIGKVTPQFVPVGKLNFNLNFGFSVALGGPAKWARKAEKGKLKDTPTVSTYRALFD